MSSRGACRQARCEASTARTVKTQAQMKALIFDCDGVILESEDLHRRAYNAAFEHFSIECSNSPVLWSEEFYDVLQNTGTEHISHTLPDRLR